MVRLSSEPEVPGRGQHLGIGYIVLFKKRGRVRKDHPAYKKQRASILRSCRHKKCRSTKMLVDELWKCGRGLLQREGLKSAILNSTDGIIICDHRNLGLQKYEVAALVSFLANHSISLIEANSQRVLTAETWEKLLIASDSTRVAEIRHELTVLKRELTTRSRNREFGAKPFGTKSDEEAATLDTIQQLRQTSGGKPRRSFQKIADILNERGRPTRFGGPWQAGAIRRIVANNWPEMLSRFAKKKKK